MHKSVEVDQFEDSPFFSIISFHLVIEALQDIANEKSTEYRTQYAKALLKEVEKVPELKTGITSRQQIYDNLDLIHYLLADLFPTALTHNEIKAVSLPFQNFNFNFTKRFQQIIKDAGDSFEINIRNFNADRYYILTCCMILNEHYGEKIDIMQPMFYDIPDANGINRYYRIMYNVDFIEIIPTDKALPITKEDISLLKKNYGNIALWKEKFPKHSWIIKGFGILTLFDVTTENAISTLKTSLIKADDENSYRYHIKIRDTFKSIFKIPDIEVGIHFINEKDLTFIDLPSSLDLVSYFRFYNDDNTSALKTTYNIFIKNVLAYNGYYSISDIDDLVQDSAISAYGKFLKENGIQSFILAPIVSIDNFQGFIEVTSRTKYALHSINAIKLEEVMPLINDMFARVQNDITNQLDAIIQREYTTIHPSVYWKFIQESRDFYNRKSKSGPDNINEIAFENVYPLYGETDIKGSTHLRNEVTRSDIKRQLQEIEAILEVAKNAQANLLFVQRYDEIQYFGREIKKRFNPQLELQIQNYIVDFIHPILKQLEPYKIIQPLLDEYKNKLDENGQKYYVARKQYDETIGEVNKNLLRIIDQAQTEIQSVFPHYFERFKTDGIEHSIFIGQSITPNLIFDRIYLFNLRLWQLQIMCKMVASNEMLVGQLPYKIELTSLIFTYNYPINIHFRMDEKRFDVEGNNDIRYEVIKKRIDKAFSKNEPAQRIVQTGCITIVYLNEEDKTEYMQYIRFLQQENYICKEVEDIDIEDVQDITGLKAIRVKINTEAATANRKLFTYNDMVRWQTIN